MTHEAETLLTALRLGDSQYPSGGFGFSWGLETLTQSNMLKKQQLVQVMQAQLEGRWASFDRVMMNKSFAATSDQDFTETDCEIEAMTWSETARAGSKRAGKSLLMSHRKLGTPHADHLQRLIRNGIILGHYPVIEGAMFKSLQLKENTAASISGYRFLSGIGSAAIRLGFAGAIEVQQALHQLTPRLAELLSTPPPTDAQSFNPLFDIAMARHEQAGNALYAN